MIHENELRIGNFVNHNDNYCYRGEDVCFFKWETRDWYAIGECIMFLENISPIPLTKEWLLNFGFISKQVCYFGEIKNIEYSLNLLENITIIYCDDLSIMIYDNLKDSSLILDMNLFKYVHQLQNLYFILTGKEI